MRAQDDRPDVDFVVGPVDDGLDEVLPEPVSSPWAGRPWPGRKRLRVPLTALAVAGVVVAAVLTVTHDGSRPRPVAAASATPPASVAPGVSKGPDELVPAGPSYRVRVRDGVVIGPVPVGPSSTPVAPLGLRADDLESRALAAGGCPTAGCIRTTRLPTGTLFALHTAYPALRDVTALSVLTYPGALRYRAVVARSGARTLEIVVRRARGDDLAQVGRMRVHGRSIVYAVAIHDGWAVVAEAYVPATSRRVRGTLQQVAGDPSLTIAG